MRNGLAIWIPVIVALITSLTTITVTYINANSKVNRINETYRIKKISQHQFQVQMPVDEDKIARVRLSVKGFVVETNH